MQKAIRRGIPRGKNQSNPIVLFVVTLICTGLFIFVWQIFDSHADGQHSELTRRADRIFQLDQSGRKLPLNQLAALSIALEFHDDQGAALLLDSLEYQARR
jgi:hypothetical protein